MGNSIQDYLKKINSRTSLLDCASVVITAVFLMACAVYLAKISQKEQEPVLYLEEDSAEQANTSSVSSLPFGSKSGTTYTFNWCQGASQTKPANKVYFANEEEAKKSGRTLSKLCAK